MKADRIGALVTALPFAVAGGLLFAGWLWASHERASAAPAKPRAAGAAPESAPETARDDAGRHAHSR